MSRLIKMDPEMKLEEEEEGKEYGYAIFEGLPPILTKQEINSLMMGETTLEELQDLNQNDQIDPVTSKEQKEIEAKIAPLLQRQNQNGNTYENKQEPIFLPNEEIVLPLEEEKLIKMQKQDKFCKKLAESFTSSKTFLRKSVFLRGRNSEKVH